MELHTAPVIHKPYRDDTEQAVPYRDDTEQAVSYRDDPEQAVPLPPFPSSKRSSNGYSDYHGSNRAIIDDEEDAEESFFLSRSGYSAESSTSLRKIKRATRYRCNLLEHWMTCRCFSSSDNSGTSTSKCKRTIMIISRIFLFLIIMVCAFAIGYSVAQDGNAFMPNGFARSFPFEAPSNLHEICSDWITAAGRQACVDACNGAAKCCTLPGNDKHSCRKSQASYCATYRSACMALELSGSDNGGGNEDPHYWVTGEQGTEAGITLPDNGLLPSKVQLTATPSYLDQICSLTSLQTPHGFDLCSTVCRPSRCCHPEVYGCHVDNDRYCSSYETKCAPTAESWRGSGHAVAADRDEGSSANSVASMVIQKCNSANLNPPDECIEACFYGACCYVSKNYLPIEQLFDQYYGATESPMKTAESCRFNVGFCQQFGACEHLNHLSDSSGWNSSNVTYEVDLHICKAEYIAEHGALECSNICQPAHCCFSEDYKCDVAGGFNCGDYSRCGVLYPKPAGNKTTQDLFELAKTIDETCSEDSLGSDESRADCENLCTGKLCCFDEDWEYGCAIKDASCLAYAGCETLVSTPLTYEDTSEPISEVAVVPVPATKTPSLQPSSKPMTEADIVPVPATTKVDEFTTTLETACSLDSLKTLEGVRQCHNKCQTHLCCFTSDSDFAEGGCFEIQADACTAYQPCARLFEPADDDYLSRGVPDSEKLAVTVVEACTLPDAASLIDDVWVRNCHRICASGLCCLSDEKIGSSCRDTLGVECSIYDPCGVLLNDRGQDMSAAQVEGKYGTIETVCAETVMYDEDQYDQCEAKCFERSCCFEDDPLVSCYSIEKSWCDEFSPCSMVDFEFTAFVPVPFTETSALPPPSTPLSEADVVPVPATNIPSLQPSFKPSFAPSLQPSSTPSLPPSSTPSLQPSSGMSEEEAVPVPATKTPSLQPSSKPSFAPTLQPSSEMSEEDAVPVPATQTPSLQPFTPISFKDMCSPSKIELNWDACKAHCSLGRLFECCFSGGNSCSDKETLKCKDYTQCTVFFEEQASNEEPIADLSLDSINSKCSLMNLGENLKQCVKWCSPYECCFFSDALSCYASNSEDCDDHEICAAVFKRDKSQSQNGTK